MDAIDIEEALVIYPGDTLVVRVRSDIYRNEFDELFTGLKANLPDNVRFLVVSAEQIAAIRATEK